MTSKIDITVKSSLQKVTISNKINILQDIETKKIEQNVRNVFSKTFNKLKGL